MAVVISSMTFFHPSFWFGVKRLFNDLFTRTNLVGSDESNIWKEGNVCWLLLTCFLIRYVIFIIFVTMPIPAGVFAPAVALGALLGRFYGEFLINYLGFVDLNTRMLSVSGAAAFAAVITRTTSPVLILLEVTGEMNYSLA